MTSDVNSSISFARLLTLQPTEKHEKNPQLAVMSSTDINVVLPVVMQHLSLKALVLSSVQYEPRQVGTSDLHDAPSELTMATIFTNHDADQEDPR